MKEYIMVTSEGIINAKGIMTGSDFSFVQALNHYGGRGWTVVGYGAEDKRNNQHAIMEREVKT